MTPAQTLTVGLLHPGQMGSALGASAIVAGARVIWASEGRSDATRARADAEGMEEVHHLADLVEASEIVISVCPPANAEEVAAEVAKLGFGGFYVDANAIAPQTTYGIAEHLERAGGRFVDGGIIGGPPRQSGTTRLYLSGDDARTVAKHLEGGPLEVLPLDAPVGAASALKMAYAAWTKGTTALLTSIEALAVHEEVVDALHAEWEISQPNLGQRSAGLGRAAAKAWRWVAEMEEIAATFEAAGLPDGFHRAAAEVFRRLEEFKDGADAPGGPDLARNLLPDGEDD